MKFRIKTKTLLISLCVAAVLVVAVYFIFIYRTPKGYATDCVTTMKEAKANYEANKGTTAAADAVQEIRQAMFDGDKYYEELKADGDAESIKEFEAIFRPVYNELQAIVEEEE